MREQRQTAAIVTLDTYRIAATDQLRAFAEMLGAPCAVASDPDDLRRILDRHADVDRIFVDTSGHGPFDNEAIAGLRSLLQPQDLASVLCVCAHARRIDVLATLSAFHAVEPSCAILTKWDETVAPGEAMSCLIEQGIPLSHITVGQEVPEDIVEARAGALAARAFGLSGKAAEEVL